MTYDEDICMHGWYFDECPDCNYYCDIPYCDIPCCCGNEDYDDCWEDEE